MAALLSRLPTRTRLSPSVLTGLVAALGLLVLGASQLLTSAFTDYAVEAEPAISALLGGHVHEGLRLLPLYGGSVLLEFPAAGIARGLGAELDGIYRAVAVPGAIGVLWLALTAARWLREAGAGTRVGLLAAGLLATAPTVSQAWQVGHPEELLVSALAIGGLILCSGVIENRPWSATETTAPASPDAPATSASTPQPRTARFTATATARVTLGAVLLGLAAAGKPWAVVVLVVAVLTAPSVRHGVRVAVTSAVAGGLLIAPMLAVQASQLSAGLQSTGGSQIFSIGNAWWFFGTPNPRWVDPNGAAGTTVVLNSITNAARLGPDFIGAHAHELIIALALALSLAWAWLATRPPGRHDLADAGRDRMTSVLLLAAAVLWWRAVLDPWFQAYYLTPALLAVVLADARRGALPIAGVITWGALWTLHGQNGFSMALSPDLRSALTLACTLPLGVWITTRALRSAR